MWNGQWTPICGHYFWNNDNGATLFCKELGCVDGELRGITPGVGTKIPLESDALSIGKCKKQDTWPNCSGGCNTMSVGGQNCGGNCDAGEKAKLIIQCNQCGGKF